MGRRGEVQSKARSKIIFDDSDPDDNYEYLKPKRSRRTFGGEENDRRGRKSFNSDDSRNFGGGFRDRRREVEEKSNRFDQRNGSYIENVELEKSPSPPPNDDDLDEDKACSSGEYERFYFFFTSRFPFSNHRRCKLKIDNRQYTCTEHYYMWVKAVTFGDNELAKQILQMTDPKEMKMAGKEVANFDQSVWDTPAQFVMMLANLEKYKQNRDLRMDLLHTHGLTLVECNPQDQRWGIALSLESDEKFDREQWRGRNWMGEILTNIRRWMWNCPDYKNDVEEVKEYIRHKRAKRRAMTMNRCSFVHLGDADFGDNYQ